MSAPSSSKAARELSDIFSKVLSASFLKSMQSSASENKRAVLASFLSNVPSSLEKYPQLLTKDFTPWLFRRLLLLTSLPHFHNLCSSAQSIQVGILRLLHTHSPSIYRETHRHLIKVLDACHSSLDDQDCDHFTTEVHVPNVSSASPGDEDDDDEALSSMSFPDEASVDAFRRCLLAVLTEAIPWTARFCRDLSGGVDEAWETAAGLIGSAEEDLLAESLRWAGAMADNGLLPVNTKAFLLFTDSVADLLESLCSDEDGDFVAEARDEVESQLTGLLRVLSAGAPSRLDRAKTLCLRQGLLSFWQTLSRKENLHGGFLCFPGALRRELSSVLAETFLGRSEQVTEEHLTNFLIKYLQEEHSEALAALVFKQMRGAVTEARREAGERSKKRKFNADRTIHEESLIDAVKESDIWVSLVDSLNQAQRGDAEDSMDVMRAAVSVSRCVAEYANRDSGLSVSVDFFPRDTIGQAVQEILHSVMQHPQDETVFVLGNRTIQDVLQVQPLETLTQSLLQQCLAVATLPWMSGEVKLVDLRLGDALTNNLIKASGKISSSSSLPRWALAGLPVASSLQKDVAPKWRQQVLRKAWADGDASTRKAIVDDLPAWLHCFGATVLPLIKEIVAQAMEKDEVDVLESLSKVCGLLACVQDRQGIARQGTMNRLECRVCDRGDNSRKGVGLQQGDVEHLIKLVGHHQPKVRLNILGVLRPMSVHVGFTPAVTAIFVNYLQDSQEECISRFSQVAHYLVGRPRANTKWDEDRGKICTVLMTAVEEVCEAAVGKDGLKLNNTLMEAVCRILASLSGAEEARERVVGSMADLLLNQATHVQAHFHFNDFLREQAANHRYLIMSKVATKLCQKPDANYVLDHVTVLFSCLNVKLFLKHHVHHILPHLVIEVVRKKKESSAAGDDATSSPVEYLAAHLNVKPRQLLAENFQFIFPHLVIHTASAQEYGKCTKYLEAETTLPLSMLLPSSRQKVITELMANFHAHQKRVLNAFNWLAKNDDSFKKKPPAKNQRFSPEDLVSYLLPRFLGVLGYFDQRLINPHVPDRAKIGLLKSLRDIIEYVGASGIASVKHKLLSTFKTAATLEVPGALSHVVKLWEVFINTLKADAMGTILAEVVANLYPLLEAGLTAETVALYRLLIVSKEKELKEYFPKLYFIPGHPDLHDINAVIKRVNRVDENTAFSDIIQLTAKSLTNETSEVKLQALRKLRQLLWPNQGKVQGLIVSSERAQPIINRLIDLLVKCTRDSDLEVVRLAGDCLGHVGAVDPGRLDLSEDLSHNLDVCLSIADDKFVTKLLSALVKSFLKCSETTDSDACAFSLQEVLSAYNVTGSASLSTPGGRVWNALSESEQEVASPFLTSLYCRTEKPVTYPIPVYNSRANMTYNDWLSDWSCHLMSRVRARKALNLFSACKAAIRKDTSCGQFLLPHIITSVIIEGDKQTTSDILKEFEVVIESAGGNLSNQRSGKSLSSPSMSTQRGLGPTREQKLAVQTVFSIMDHLNKWMRSKYRVLQANMRRSDSAAKIKSKDKEYSAVEAFVQSVSQSQLAEASHNCGAYARALMHMENHLRSNPDQLQGSLFKLQKIYSGLHDPDYVVGAAAVREAEATLEERIFLHQATGNYQDALGCFEGLSKNSQGDVEGDVLCGTVECYLKLDRPHTAAMLARGRSETSTEVRDKLKGYQMEAAWQLSKWEDISDGGEEQTKIRCWKSDLARLLLSAERKSKSNFFKQLELLQRNETSSITAASMEEASYQRSYEHVVRLQILNEVEQLTQTALFASDKDLPSKDTFQELFAGWKTRTSFARYTLENQESVLKVRRTLLQLAKRRLASSPELRDLVTAELGENMVMSAKVSRKAGQLEKAFNVSIDAEQFGPAELFLERAKLHWTRQDKEVAIDILREGIKTRFPWSLDKVEEGRKNRPRKEVEICASAKLLLARYVDEAANQEGESVPKLYNDARVLAASPATLEAVFYHIARFYDKVIGRNYKQSDLDMKGDIVYHVVCMYCKSLIQGHDNIHQSLPRLLSLWLDYGARVVASDAGSNQQQGVHAMSSASSSSSSLPSLVSQQQSTTSARAKADMVASLKKINEVMAKFKNSVPTDYFLLVFPQLTSRICHPHPSVWSILRDIMVKTFVAFPHQTFWHMVALSKSSFETRSKRCREIFSLAEKEAPKLKKFLSDGISLADKLHLLAEEKLPHGVQDLTEVMPSLIKLFMHKGFSRIMVPTTKNMSVVLPSVASVTGRAEDRVCYFSKPEAEITVMRSLVAPKKVTFLASDGHKYSFLCKPKDDLRRDCRLIDFNNLLNKLFVRDPECRRRNLRIRTYKVVPLNETSGIIEWVENLTPLRTIVQKLHREIHGVNPIGRSDQDKFATSEDDREKNRRSYRELTDRYPPVFAEWFVRNFPDPQTWFLARLGYTRTTAVMSMVGYLLGLGDRHAENIMYDASNGDSVHVDLNCLFNKGDELKIPEVVPFRLTRNLVHAMGPTGYEGPFRIACEVSLGLMRRQKDLLMSALRPFYFDPLVDWVQGGRRRQQLTQPDAEGDGGNEKAVETLAAIEARLDGLVKRKGGGRGGSGKGNKMINMPLSVAGQVDFLIKEAVSEENLSQMYLGWASYY